MKPEELLPLSRRNVIVVGASTAVALGLNSTASSEEIVEELKDQMDLETSSAVSMTVNGRKLEMVVDNRVTLLDALREGLKFTGTKKGCDHGQCGACTALVNGKRINSCLSLAVMHDGDEIQTIEGIGTPDKLDPMQEAFIKYDGYQCGYCTPGQICSAKAVLEEIKAGIPSHVTDDLNGRIEATADEIKERMSGNICRCGAYSNILSAIQEVSERSA
ncbi:aldehyde dehydrogenase iron-sulfur subunit PaoA [Ponticaulis profundi]|uniref:Aldehyde dehydrogenase iron-sulfur subunit PaoA n=1 Tax=Ponticaulis profundi TaxID=2665222 RepID=A0ABW1SDW8_9PROT